MDTTYSEGFPSFKIKLTFLNTLGTAFTWSNTELTLNSLPNCIIESSDSASFSCSVVSDDLSYFIVAVTPSTSSATITESQEFSIRFYVNVMGSGFYSTFSTVKMQAEVYMPILISTTPAIFGSTYDSTIGSNMRFSVCTQSSNNF